MEQSKEYLQNEIKFLRACLKGGKVYEEILLKNIEKKDDQIWLMKWIIMMLSAALMIELFLLTI